MVEDNAPKYKDGMPLGTSHDTGSGIRLGQSVGGKTDHMDRVTAWRMINPANGFCTRPCGKQAWRKIWK